MNNTVDLLSRRECAQVALARKLRDFKQWMSPSSQATYNWKQRKLKSSIIVARDKMKDDAEAMLRAIQKEDTANNIGDETESGTSVYLPVMIVAMKSIMTPPTRDQVVGIPNWINGMVSTDPLNRVIQMRTLPASYECQVAFYAPDPHTAGDMANQFCLFWQHEAKRTFPIVYELGFAGDKIIAEQWDFRCIENELMPDDASGSIDTENLSIVIIDFTIVGLEPIVTGLGAVSDAVTDTGEPVDTLDDDDLVDGYDDNGNPIDGYIDIIGPIPGAITPPEQLQSKVIEADIIDHNTKIWRRVSINPDNLTITEINGTGTPPAP